MKWEKLFLIPQHTSEEAGLAARERPFASIDKVDCLWAMILMVAFLFLGRTAYSQELSSGAVAQGNSGQASVQSGQGNLAEIGAKLSNPVSDVWALFTEFDLYFSDGDLNKGSSKVGGRMIFQPILPFPLYGRGEDQWKLITRPTIPVLFSQPVPKGFDEFSHLGGLFVAKTVKLGKVPVKFQFGVEYSVVSQDDFGQRAQIKLNIIPVIPSLVKNPLLGGN